MMVICKNAGVEKLMRERECVTVSAEGRHGVPSDGTKLGVLTQARLK